IFGPRNVVYYASTNEDGSLGSWQATTPMPQKLMGHAVVVNNNRMYVMGGMIRSAWASANVYYADILEDKTLSPWKTISSLPINLLGHKAITLGNKIYIIGGTVNGRFYATDGSPNNNISSKVYMATVLEDGSLSAWQETSSMLEPLTLHAASTSGKNIYTLGGYNGTGITNAVYFAPVLDDGSLGSWQALHSMPKNLLGNSSVANEEYLYSLGGGLSYITDPQSDITFLSLKKDPRAFVQINPKTLNTKSNGKWITVIVGLPEADVNDINPSTVKISEINNEAIEPIFVDPKWTTKIYEGDSEGFDKLDDHTYAMFKFSRKKVSEAVPKGNVTVKIEGLFNDGTAFEGTNTDWTIHASKNFRKTMHERVGIIKSPQGHSVYIPADAFPGNPELLLTIENEDENSLSNNEKAKRNIASGKKNLKAISKAVEFGPHGMKFEKPVTIALNYDTKDIPEGTDEENLKICYWNRETEEWEAMASTVSKEEHLVKADVFHFSVYQIMIDVIVAEAPAETPAEAFALGNVYVFPNPAAAVEPKMHIESKDADSVLIRIYSLSGRQVKELNINQAATLIDDGTGAKFAYETALGTDMPSGIYLYYVEVKKNGVKLKKTGKFAIVR
ncbi:MAG: T9SS type A sorting domain-containing protein, partial [Elusimicrobia bacterium]|nr:T9SS type A sorting domain-containing protein [Elusimicrobiota bacterium]